MPYSLATVVVVEGVDIINGFACPKINWKLMLKQLIILASYLLRLHRFEA